MRREEKRQITFHAGSSGQVLFLDQRLKGACFITMNRKILSLSLSISCLYFAFILCTHAAFTDRPGLRAIGMGGAFSAVADDGSAAMWNPAGLAQLTRSEVQAQGGQLFIGLDEDVLAYGYISYVEPFGRLGTLGLSGAQSYAELYKETTATLSYSQKLGGVYLGCNVKGLFTSFAEENEYIAIDPLFQENGFNQSRLSVDAGALMKLGRLALAVAIYDINQPKIDLEEADIFLPATFKYGLALNGGPVIAAVDTTLRNYSISDKLDINVHFGLEAWFANRSLGLRAGGNLCELTAGASYAFNVNRAAIQFDYALRYPNDIFQAEVISGTYGSHLLALCVRFGGEEAPQGIIKDTAVESLLKKGDYQGAADEYENLIETGADDSAFYLKLARLQLHANDYDKAIATYEKASEVFPQHPEFPYELGKACERYAELTHDKNWLQKAVDAYEKTIKIDKKYKDTQFRLTMVYVQKGQFDDARQQLRQ